MTLLFDFVVLPKDGRLSQDDKEKEYLEDFVGIRKQLSAIESTINALEVYGLDGCFDHGIDGFKKYVVLAILGRNIQQFGLKLRHQKLGLQKVKEKLKKLA